MFIFLKNKVLWAAFGLLVAGILALTGYDLLKANSERVLLEEGEALSRAGDIQGALRHARLLYDRNPESAPAARLMARELERIDPPMALPWWNRTWELEPDDFEAYTRVLTLSLAVRPPDEILRLIGKAHPYFQDNPDFHKLAAVAHLQSGRPDASHASFTQALELRPEDAEARLGRLLIEAQARDAGQADRAFREILRKSEPGQPAEAQALFNLVTSNLNERLTEGQIVDYADQYLHLETDDYFKRLKLAVSASIRSPSNTDRWFRMLEEEARAEPERLPSYAHIMNQVGEVQRVLALHSVIASHRERLPRLNDVFLDALILEGRWADGVAWADTIPEEVRSPWHDLARDVAAKNGQWRDLDREKLRLSLKRIESPEPLRKIASRAQFHQWHAVTEAALWAEAEIKGSERRAARELLRWYQTRQEGRGLYLAAEHLLKFEPDSLPARATVAHLSLCLGVGPARAHRLAKECYEASPDSPPLRMIYLLSLHIQGADDQVSELMSGFAPSDRHLPGMDLYFDYFDWVSGTRTAPPSLESIPEGYLDLEIQFLRQQVLMRGADVRPHPG